MSTRLIQTIFGAAIALAGLAAVPATAADPFSAVYVMSDNLGDMGFNDNAATGFAKAEKEGVKTRLLQASPSDPHTIRPSTPASMLSL